MTQWNFALSGAILLGYWAIGLFFFRFHRQNSDRFFLFFGWAFWILACERILLLGTGTDEDVRPFIYLVRLVAFLFIIFAIYDKNRGNHSKAQARRG